MANRHTTLKELFDAIAKAIRAKKGTTGAIVADNFPSEIESILTRKPEEPTNRYYTKNGTYSIVPPEGKVFSSVGITVNVSGGGSVAGIPTQYYEITLSETASGNVFFLSKNRFVAEHYRDNGFFCLVWAAPPNGKDGFIEFIYGANVPMLKASGGADCYGLTVVPGKFAQINFRRHNTRLSENTDRSGGALLVSADGTVFIQTDATNKIHAGKYYVLVGVLPVA